MAYHKIRIRLRGCNEFTEKFPGGSVADAKALAKSRYPDAQYISWIGGAVSDEQEERNRQWSIDYKKKVDENNERVFGKSGRNVDDFQVDNSESYSTGGGRVSSAASDIAGMGLIVGGFVFLVILSIIIIFAPVVAFVGTGKMAYGQVRKLNIKTVYTILITLAISTGAGAGTHRLQQEYMPETVDTQQEMVVGLYNYVKGNWHIKNRNKPFPEHTRTR